MVKYYSIKVLFTVCEYSESMTLIQMVNIFFVGFSVVYESAFVGSLHRC